MVFVVEGWLFFSFIGEFLDGEDEGIDEGFGVCFDLWIYGLKFIIFDFWWLF